MPTIALAQTPTRGSSSSDERRLDAAARLDLTIEHQSAIRLQSCLMAANVPIRLCMLARAKAVFEGTRPCAAARCESRDRAQLRAMLQKNTSARCETCAMCFTAACAMSTKGFLHALVQRIDPFWVIEHVSSFHTPGAAFPCFTGSGTAPRAALV